MNKIKIMSRYNEPRYFEEIENGYIYSFEDEYCRVGFKDNPGEIQFIDPSGGPFISVNTDLEDTHPDLKGIVKSIERIDKGYLIKIK